MRVIFHVGYQIPSSFFGEVIEAWLDQAVDVAAAFTKMLMSCEFVWKSTSFTKFEGRIIGRLACNSDDLMAKLVKKLSVSDQDIDSIEGVLLLAERVAEGIHHAERRDSAVSAYLKKCNSVMERTVQEGDMSDHIWNIASRFVSQSDDIDMEKWLGIICKRDTEDLNPKASAAIQGILHKDQDVFHRLLPGWMVRTFSRLTRRFAEDQRLSESTLNSVKDFSMLCNFNAYTQIL